MRCSVWWRGMFSHQIKMAEQGERCKIWSGKEAFWCSLHISRKSFETCWHYYFDGCRGPNRHICPTPASCQLPINSGCAIMWRFCLFLFVVVNWSISSRGLGNTHRPGTLVYRHVTNPQPHLEPLYRLREENVLNDVDVPFQVTDIACAIAQRFIKELDRPATYNAIFTLKIRTEGIKGTQRNLVNPLLPPTKNRIFTLEVLTLQKWRLCHLDSYFSVCFSLSVSWGRNSLKTMDGYKFSYVTFPHGNFKSISVFRVFCILSLIFSPIIYKENWL